MSPNGRSPQPPPEERLLRLIRDNQEAGHEPSAPTAPGPNRGAVPAWSRRGLGSWPRAFWFRLSVAGLGLILAAELVALVVEVTRPLPELTVPGPSPTAEPLRAVPSPETFRSLAASAPRSLFSSPVAAPAEGAPTRVPSQAANQLAARLTLLGVVSGEPAQAIIEDAQTQKTYFVSVGQAVVDGAVVEAIRDNRVILDLEGQKIELSL